MISLWSARRTTRRTSHYREAIFAGSLFLIFLGLSSIALSQEATILGTVTDPSGSVIPNVSVTATNTDTGQVRTITTNDSGQYVIPDLHIGKYNVKADASGFTASERTGVVLNVDDRARVDFDMKIGSTNTTVTVEAEGVKVQTDSGEVSNVITGEQVTQLATNGRSVYALFALTPGASGIQGDFIANTPVSGDSNVSINGQRAGHNLQLLDGGENLDRGGSSGSVAPSLDAIAEFRNLTSNYSAEYGLSTAATITTVLKSGTKQFHASAWEFLRNDALNARNYFNPAVNANGTKNKVAELRFNTFGFNVGGPVEFKRSENPKTFFFYNMEWRRTIQGGLLNQTVPLPSTYGGDFSSVGLSLTKLHAPFSCQLSTAQQGRFSAAGQPLSGCTANSSGVLVPDNTKEVAFNASAIPSSILDPNAQALLHAGGKYGGIFPAPTNGTQFQGGNNSPTNVKEEIARIDHQFTDKFSVFGHWVSEQISQNYGTTQWSGDNVPSISDVFGNPSYSAVVHTTYVISPTLLNEAAFNYNGNRINIIPQGLIAAPSGFAFNRLFTGPNADNRIPSIQLNGSTGTNYTANWTPWINKADDYQFRDDISWTKGAHQLKFGASWAIYKKIQDWFANTEGNFNFNGAYTGNDFADYLLGYAQGYNEAAVKSSGHWNNKSYAAYVQDNWRATNRLTLNLGLRWDGVPHTYEANQGSSNFYPNLYNPGAAATFDTAGHICSGATDPGCTAASPGLGTSPNPILAGLLFYTNGIGIGGKNGIPAGLVNDHWATFGPRLGFAYDVTGGGKTVVRGGFGLMYERVQGNDMYNGATNTPFDAFPTLNNVLLSNPGTSISDGTTISAANLPILPVGITGVDRNNYKPPYSLQYSVGIQQGFGASSVLSLSYVGSQGRHENDYRAVNLPPESLLPALVAGTSSTPLNKSVPYLGFGGIRLGENEANSRYNSLQVDFHSNLRRDLLFEFGYTYSKAIDATTSNGSGGDLQNVSNPYVGWRYDSGPSPYDRTHVAFVNFVYQIPFLKNSDHHLLKAVAGGWELSGIITMESGAPLNIGLNGNNVTSILTNTSNRPNVSGPISYPKTVAQWFNTSNFSKPVCATGPDCWGNLGHDQIRGPGRDNWNLSLFKEFVISESRGSRFEFRAESFNTWNHTQFKGDYNNGGISTNFGASNFGAVTAAFDPREFQLGAKLIF